MIDRLRGKSLLVVLIIVTLIGHIPLLQRTIRLSSIGWGNDRVSAYEKRFEPLQAEINGQGRVGYVTNLPPDSIPTDAVAVEHFYIAQYALAPSVLVWDPNTAFIIGDFATNEIPARLEHLEIIKRYDGGLVLFRGNYR